MTPPVQEDKLPTRQSARLAGGPSPEIQELFSKTGHLTQVRPLKPANMETETSTNKNSNPDSSLTTPGLEESSARAKQATDNVEKVGQDLTNRDNQMDKQIVISTEEDDYPNVSDDPLPLSKTATNAEKAEHDKIITQYTKEMLTAYKETEMDGQSLWLDFTTAFRPETIKLWSRPMIAVWADFLTKRGIHVDEGRKRPRVSTIIDLLYRKIHIPSRRMDVIKIDAREQVREEFKAAQPTILNNVETKNENTQTVRKHDQTNITTNPVETKQTHSQKEQPADSRSTRPSGSPDDSSDSSDDDSLNGNEHSGIGAHEESNATPDSSAPPDPSTTQKPQTSHYEKSDKEYPLGINGLVKAFQKEDKFGGLFEDDLERSIRRFKTLTTMCEVPDKAKLRAIPVMLHGDALDFFDEYHTSCESFEEVFAMLRTWYQSTEQRARILSEWQQLRLTSEMEKSPEESEVSVFRRLVARLMTLQKQLDAKYQGDGFLIDQLLNAVDIPGIQIALKDRMPRKAQHAVHRIANRLSDKPRTAGASCATYTGEETFAKQDIEAHYSLGKTFGGAAKKQMKPYRKPAKQKFNRKRLSSSWMRGVKGCFVCGDKHRARDRHPREEVAEAIRKLKEQHPRALITVEDLDSIYNMDDKSETDAEIEAQWAEGDTDSENDDDLAFVTEDDKRQIEIELSDAAFLHGCSEKSKRDETWHSELDTEDNKFMGIRLDTCANRTSVMSIHQYRIYCKHFGLKSSIRPISGRAVKGIGGISKAIGEAKIQIPFRELGIIIDIDFLILPDTIPTLLSMKDMLDNQLDISIQDKHITYGGKRQKLRFENYFLIHNWVANDLPYVLYTYDELKRIHSSFGHPSIRATRNLLKRASSDSSDSQTNAAIRQISENCATCNRLSAAPRRFRLTVGSAELKFNHRVQVDTMWIRGRPVVHMIDTATHFCAARFVRKQTTIDIWRAIRNMWTLMYCGPPDFLEIDQGTNYISTEFKGIASAEGVTIKEAPIESPNTIGTVERYHAPLRRAYESLRDNLPKTTHDDECLLMATYAMNTTTGPEGLCPMLLVYGALPRPARATPAATQIERATAMETAKKEAMKELAKRRIAYGLKHNGGPKGYAHSTELRKLPAGAFVYIFRTKPKTWEGPHRFISIDGETVVVQMPRGRRIFRSTAVKPYIRSLLDDPNNQSDHHQLNNTDAEVFLQEDNPKDIFKEARITELEGLISNGTFKKAKRHDIPDDTRVFGSRFIDELKKADHGIRRKSRLIAQNYCDTASASISTKAPTVQRSSQRLLLALAISLENVKMFSRDITQAYVQSRTLLERPVFIKPPIELDLPPDIVLKVMKPLYGIPESGLHWYLTYLEHHLGELSMKRIKADPCVLVRRKKGQVDGIVVLQVDDSLGLGTKDFLTDEEKASKSFNSKDRKLLEDGEIRFNGLTINMKSNKLITATQPDKIQRLSTPSTQEEFTSERALAQYIGVCTRPDVCAGVQLLAPGKEPTTGPEINSLTKNINRLKETMNSGLNFVPLNMENARLILITDAAFANARGHRSQLGYLILLADSDGNCNIVHYSSNRCKRVTRSALAAEVHALVAGFDNCYVIREMTTEILGRKLPIEAMIDSRTLFDVVAKDGNTQEKRLQIDIFSVRESYEHGELSSISWIPGKFNPADGLTKQILKATSPLWDLMSTNKLKTQALGWSNVPTNTNRKMVGV